MKTQTISLKNIINKGLVSARNRRDNPMLIQVIGAHVYEGSLESVDQFDVVTLPATPITPFAFPFPQLLVLSDVILLANIDQIWEYAGSGGDNGWVSKISGLAAGALWTYADGKSFIILSNQQVTVTKDPLTGAYSINNKIPFGNIGNFNGQISVGSPGIQGYVHQKALGGDRILTGDGIPIDTGDGVPIDAT